MKKIAFISLLFVMLKPCMAKDGSISLKEAIHTRHYIWGGELLNRITLKNDIYYTVLVKDIIKGKLKSDTVKLRFMYESEGRQYVHENLKYVACIVDMNSGESYFEDSYYFNIRSFGTIQEYNNWINYYRDANAWISKKNQIKKSDWIARYISDSLFQNEIFFELALHYKAYGVINSDAQQIVKNIIIKNFDHHFSTASGIHVLSGKHKKQVLDFILSKLDVNDHDKTCSIMDIMWYIDDNKGWKLHSIWDEYCVGELKSDTEYQNLIDKFKTVAK